MGEEYRVNLLARVEEMDYSQLRMTEWQELFERHCDGDLQLIREYVRLEILGLGLLYILYTLYTMYFLCFLLSIYWDYEIL